MKKNFLYVIIAILIVIIIILGVFWYRGIRARESGVQTRSEVIPFTQQVHTLPENL